MRNNALPVGMRPGAHRLHGLRITLTVEERTAQALRYLKPSPNAAGATMPVPLICGRMMLKHLGCYDAIVQFVQPGDAPGESEEQLADLRKCLSRWAYPWILFEQHQYDEVIAFITERMRGMTLDGQARELLGDAYFHLGSMRAKAREFAQALQAWRLAVQWFPAGSVRVAEIKQEAETLVIEEISRLQHVSSPSALELSVKYLEQLRAYIENERISENLADRYYHLYQYHWHDRDKSLVERRKLALECLRKAIGLNPNHREAVESYDNFPL